MQNSGGPMAQGNTKGSLDPDGTRPALFQLMNKEHSRGGQSLEALTKSHNHFCCRRMVINKTPPVLAQIVFFCSSNKLVLPFEGSTGLDPDQNFNYSFQISKRSYLFLVILNP